MNGSSAEAQGAPPSGEPPSGSVAGQKFWEFADLGYDTQKRLWFIQFYNASNENVGTYFANTVDISGGRAAQYQWKDAKGAPFWHVRERFYATQIDRLSVDPGGGVITLLFKEEEEEEVTEAPSEFEYLLYAYHLTSKGSGRAPMGFVEFYGADGSPVGRIENRWIIIERLKRRTFGEYPGVRIRAERRDVGSITVTGTSVVIKGRSAG